MSNPPPTTWRRLWIVVLAATLPVAACASSGDDSASTSPPTEESIPNATASPTDEPTPAPTSGAAAGSDPDPDSEALAAVRSEFESWAAFNNVPGAVLAVTLGEDSAALSYGVTDLIEPTPVTEAANFRIGSVTKTVTSAVMLQLVDEGLVDLDERVNTYLPDWTNAAAAAEAEDITLRQLLQHTSGFADYAVDPAFYVQALPRLDTAVEPQEIIGFSLEQGLLFEPGTAYNYSTTNYLIAGLIIEAVTGNPADVEFRTRVFEPLGLEHLFLTPAEVPPEGIANGYMDLRDVDPDSELAGLATLLDTFSGLLPEGSVLELEDGLVLDVGALPQEFLRSVAWTGGGIEGLTTDMVRLIPGYFNSGMLSAESLTELTTPSEHHNRSVGLSIDEFSDYTIYSHGGTVPGYRAGVAYIPELDLSLAVQTNAVPLAYDVHELLAALAKLVADATA